MTRKSKYEFLKKKKCACCGCKSNLTVDHIIPKAYGYTVVNNRQPLCLECNRNKGILIIDYQKKTSELEPYMFGLNEDGVKELFNNTFNFSGRLFKPGRSLEKYMK
jgi:hypothetical protein